MSIWHLHHSLCCKCMTANLMHEFVKCCKSLWAIGGLEWCSVKWLCLNFDANEELALYQNKYSMPFASFYIIGPGMVTKLLRVAYYTGTSVIIITIIPGEVRLWPCWVNNILVDDSWMSLSYTQQKAGVALLSQQFKPTMWKSSHSISLDWLETSGHLCPGPQSWDKQLRKIQDSQYEFILRLVVILQIPSYLWCHHRAQHRIGTQVYSHTVCKDWVPCTTCLLLHCANTYTMSGEGGRKLCSVRPMWNELNTHIPVFSVFLIKK